MTTDEGFREESMQFEQEKQQLYALRHGASVGREAFGVETTFAADANGTTVEGTAVCSDIEK